MALETIDLREHIVHDDVDTHDRLAFVRWGIGTFAVALAVIVTVALVRTDGHLIYVLDDPAIHLSVAENLAHHGTWGVTPGHFQSASSSPVWTVLLAGYVRLSGPAADSGPLVLNALSATAVVAILGLNQQLLFPHWRRPLHVLATVVLVVGVLFLPALAMVGMEHTLHMALALAIVVLFHRAALGEPGRWPRWLPYALTALAALVRFETLFLAAGVAVALLAETVPGWAQHPARPSLRTQARPALLVMASAALPVAAFAAANHAMGQGLLPNSVLAKGGLTNGQGHALRLHTIFGRLTEDPVLVVLLALAVGALVLGWGQRRRYTFAAAAFVPTVLAHAVFADIGWYERYQAYLIALGVYVALAIATEALPARRTPGRSQLVAAVLVVGLLFGVSKVQLTGDVPTAAADTYEQRYQAARFLERYYHGQPVATGELGYVSLIHQGPITDLLGLGDYEVLQERRATGGHPGPDYWADLIQRRRVRVAAIYPVSMLYEVPDTWVLVGTWTLPRKPITAFEPEFQFWATTPAEVAPLRRRLEEFSRELPDGVGVKFNQYAELRAAQLESEGSS